jgi:hypothetical protein
MVYGRVYAIRSHQTTDIYIGSTEQILCKRMSDHRKVYNSFLNDKQGYITSYEVLKYEDAYIELIFEGEFESKDALRKKEGEYQRSMDCVNIRIDGRTQKEWQKQHYQKHKEEIKKKSIQHYEENKDTILKRYSKKFTCECGGCFTHGNKSTHEKTKKHLEYIKNSV